MHNATLHVANASGILTPYLSSIQSAFERATRTCAEPLSLDNVDVICIHNPRSAIAQIGVGGYALNRNTVYLYLNGADGFNEDEAYYTLSHELHHARRYYGEGYGQTLFDAIVFEGLAVCFEEEISQGAAFLSKHLKEQPYKTLLAEKVAPHFDDTTFDHYKWFLSASDDLPKWAGYIIGYHLLSKYIEAKNTKASDLVLVDAKDVREFVRQGF